MGERSVRNPFTFRDKWKQRSKHWDLTDLPFTDQGESATAGFFNCTVSNFSPNTHD